MFEPMFNQTLGEDEWLYIVNFYGQMDNNALMCWKQKCDRVIIDNAQSYFQMPIEGVDTLYTCRKYFGVADGAFLYTDMKLKREIPQDESFERMHFLLGRFERCANQFYSEYVANNKLFATEQVKQMSQLTENLLHGIDYESIAKKRQDNFDYLDGQFYDINELSLKASMVHLCIRFWFRMVLQYEKNCKKKKSIFQHCGLMCWKNVRRTALNIIMRQIFCRFGGSTIWNRGYEIFGGGDKSCFIWGT